MKGCIVGTILMIMMVLWSTRAAVSDIVGFLGFNPYFQKVFIGTSRSQFLSPLPPTRLVLSIASSENIQEIENLLSHHGVRLENRQSSQVQGNHNELIGHIHEL